MDSMLKGLFGGGGDENARQQQANDFASRYTQGDPSEGYSGQEAMEHFQRVAQYAPPEVFQQAAQQTFGGMDPGQRAQFAQMLQQQMGGQAAAGISADPRDLAGAVTQIHQQNPGGLASLFGGGQGGFGGSQGGGGLGDLMSNPLAKVALGGIAAYGLKQMMGGQGKKSGGFSV